MFPYTFYKIDVSTVESLTHQDSYTFLYIQRQLCLAQLVLIDIAAGHWGQISVCSLYSFLDAYR